MNTSTVCDEYYYRETAVLLLPCKQSVNVILYVCLCVAELFHLQKKKKKNRKSWNVLCTVAFNGFTVYTVHKQCANLREKQEPHPQRRTKLNRDNGF